jgi:hypothetical protein
VNQWWVSKFFFNVKFRQNEKNKMEIPYQNILSFLKKLSILGKENGKKFLTFEL